ncbi:non-hydrolyzing UDP-N-acetylglucosamine 2-epimerase [Vibrio sp. VB16]|uniref:non-hydrolyzing UDP-N-acetylglucosamine 2-epimerase n=1 Tax=Vibrio sp. VB16 TaxID=2785746 RepID=UPI00189DBFA3|nr:UDP-N-acetylglucosamine 2-epimerase (non-hydrolyzing) [Vibrio sp. VB16]UGA54994.1 UDP-N-acetylglucosamine 2-epimerase (non-hydrolyzing) [Vibrio sp. VB16]
MKIVTVLGARPQFIKAGTVSREILRAANRGADISEVIVHTGQHYDFNMSDVFFDEMRIPKPNYYLGIGGGMHGEMTGEMIKKIEQVLLKEKPDFLMVYGDTNSTLAGAIAASKLGIKIAHVEAGLRSFNKDMPEEINRILTDRISKLLFCPTEIAVQNLEDEGVALWGNSEVLYTGDVMLDGVNYYSQFSSPPDTIMDGEPFVLATIHRAENTNDENKLRAIIQALDEIAMDKRVYLPLHPRTASVLKSMNAKVKNITFIEPVGYLNMLWLINHCDSVITDSGGLQKEAFFFKKPCITVRDETEWVELIEQGYNKLVGACKTDILNSFHQGFSGLMFDQELYGNGQASELIVQRFLDEK